MLQTYKSYTRRTLAMLLAVLVAVGALFSGSFPVHAADGTISYKAGANIPYGSYFTSRMSFDGSNTAYCVEPLKKTPSSGSYSYDLLSQNSPLRKALYYLNGGYGYDKVVKDKYFSGWSDDNSYVIGHLVVAYIYAGNSADTGAFHGAPQSYIDKALEVASAIQGLPNPPEGFRAFIVPGQGSQTIAGSWYQVPNGWIELKKSSANGSVSDGNPNYSLKGAVYGIYQGEKLIQKLTTDENGYARSGELEEGDYTIKELSASKGYIVDTKAHKVTVKAEQTSAANVTDIPQNNPMNLVLEKLDAETKKASPQGAASLANAEFTVKFYTEQSDSDPAEAGKKPARTWVLKTDVSGKMHFTKDSFVSGDAFYYTSDGKTVCLPLGTITVQESKAPAGYQLNPTVFVQKITGDGKQEMVSVYQSSTIEESVIRGGVKIQKRDSETGEAKPQGSATLEGTVFAITTLNENPVLVDGTSYTKDQVVLTLTADKSGSVFEELYQDEMQLAVHTDINDEDQTIYFPEIKTTAKDADTNSNISCAKEEITLVDTVSFKGLVPNQKYEVTGTLIDKETKKPVEADGKPVTAKASFKPKESAGTVDVTFTFDASSLKGKTVVVFESLAYKDKEVAVHTDIADEGQTIYFPEIKTTATDAASGTHYAKPEKELTLTDLVEYKNLIPGKEYKLTGTLMDAETEKPFDVDGKAVTAETSFTPEEANGSVELSFTFDASALSGKTLVAFETMTFEDHEVAVHADIKDANQTIYFPEIKTTAKDGSDGDQDVSASKEATIVDTVTYHGLMPGSEYKVIGTLMNKETGEALLKDGKPVTAQAEFKAEKAGGSVEVTFTFDASALAGQDVVVFEKLYYTDGKTEHEIASHEDLKDEGQTVHMTELSKEPETPPVAPPVKTGDETPLLLYAGIAIAALAGASVLGIVYFKRKKKHQ